MTLHAIKNTALAVGVAAVSVFSAQAATYELGSMQVGTTYQASSTLSPSFSDIFNFTIAGNAFSALGSIALIVNGGGSVVTGFSLFDGTTTSAGSFTADPIASSGFLKATLSPGKAYALTVSGSGTGDYITTFRIAAVPEPETYAMLLAGMGLVGFVARRRKAR